MIKKRVRGDAQLFELTAVEKRIQSPTLKHNGEGCYLAGRRALMRLTPEENKRKRHKANHFRKHKEDSPSMNSFVDFSPAVSTVHDSGYYDRRKHCVRFLFEHFGYPEEELWPSIGKKGLAVEICWRLGLDPAKQKSIFEGYLRDIISAYGQGCEYDPKANKRKRGRKRIILYMTCLTMLPLSMKISTYHRHNFCIYHDHLTQFWDKDSVAYLKSVNMHHRFIQIHESRTDPDVLVGVTGTVLLGTVRRWLVL